MSSLLAALLVASLIVDPAEPASRPARAPPPAPVAAPAAAPAAEGPAAPLDSRIQQVVVYGASARVLRAGELPGTGQYVLPGLPGGLDADSVRVRVPGGSVVSVEVADRYRTDEPDARRQELRDRVAALLAQQRELRDNRDVAAATRDHLLRMMGQEEQAHVAELAAGRPAVDAWRDSLEFVTAGLTQASADMRGLDTQLEAVGTRLQDAQAELGRVEGEAGVHLRDVLVDVVAPAAGTIEVEYLVGGAGWSPLYDLRTSADARSVELLYRAKVWQQTGEDWKDTTLLLSTAQPQRGAQGPEPRPLQVRVRQPPPAASAAGASRAFRLAPEAAAAPADSDGLQALGYVSDAADEMAAMGRAVLAEVVDQGLSVQFKLPRAETIESRDRPTTVLIGQQALEVEPEHYCTPALDTTVWLRGRTRNTTPWTMLPGLASVYFGSDFIGQAAFDEPLLPEQEFTLHLGADPGVAVERTQTEDLHEEPGFLSRRQSQTEAWRVHLQNTAAQATAEDGTVEILVREAMPRSTDDRIEVSVLQQSAAPLLDERWKRDLDEKGVHTWRVRVPKGGAVDVTWRLRVTWPDDLQVDRTATR